MIVMNPGLAAGAIIGAIVVIGVLAAALRGNYEKTLRGLATSAGLAYERLGTPGVAHRLTGLVDGRPFTLLVAPEGIGSGRYLHERWELRLVGALPAGFAAGKKGWLSSASPGTVRVESGDPQFDKHVMVEATNPRDAWFVLEAPHRRDALLQLAGLGAILAENKVMFHKSGLDNNVATLQRRLATLRAIAAALDPVTPR